MPPEQVMSLLGDKYLSVVYHGDHSSVIQREQTWNRNAGRKVKYRSWSGIFLGYRAEACSAAKDGSYTPMQGEVSVENEPAVGSAEPKCVSERSPPQEWSY